MVALKVSVERASHILDAVVFVRCMPKVVVGRLRRESRWECTVIGHDNCLILGSSWHGLLPWQACMLELLKYCEFSITHYFFNFHLTNRTTAV